MKRFLALALAPALLATVPAAATVTFDGVRLYSGSATFLGDQHSVVSPQIISATPGDFSLPNDNDHPMNGTLLDPTGNTASVHTVMQVATGPSGSSFSLEGRADASYGGLPLYWSPSASSDNQFFYYFTTDTPFNLLMHYAMPAQYTLNSDYYEVSARFDSLHVMGGLAADRSDSGSLFQYHRNLRDNDPDKTVDLLLPAGVYTLSLFGNVNAHTYHPGSVTALTDASSILVTNLNPVAGVPEPANWALLIAGFGLTGAAMRRRRRGAALTA